MSHIIFRCWLAALALVALAACQGEDAPTGAAPGQDNGGAENNGQNNGQSNGDDPVNNGDDPVNNGATNNGDPSNNGQNNGQPPRPLRAERSQWVGVLAPKVEWTSLFASYNGGETHWRCRPSAQEGSDRVGWDCLEANRENGGETHWTCRPEVANGGETHWFCAQASRENGGETHWLCRPPVANGGETHWRCAELAWDDFSVGQGVACGVGGGRVRCWGDDLLRRAIPQEELVAIAAGKGAACGLDLGGVPRCWSSQEGSPLLLAPPVPLLTLSLGSRHACGLRSDGGAECWGDDGLGQASPPLAPLLAVSAGGQASCGLSLGGRVLCWGGGPVVGEGLPEGDGFVAVTVGEAHACGLRGDGDAVCWGDNTQGQLDLAAQGWRALSAGASHTCGLDAEGTAHCWGAPEASLGLPAVALTRLSTGRAQSCGLTEEAALVCWGATFDEEAPPRCGAGQEGPENACGGCGALSAQPGEPCAGSCEGAVVQCAGQEATVCAEVTPANACGGCSPLPLSPAQPCGACGEGVVGCDGQEALSCSCDEVEASELVAGEQVTCATSGLLGAVRCWGDELNPVTEIPELRWSKLSLGRRHVCGVDFRDIVTCFGDGDRGQLLPTTPVTSNLLAMASAGDSTCALTLEPDPVTNHNLYCWGEIPPGYADGLVPEALFDGLALGYGHLCVWDAGAVTCIGADDRGQATPPPDLGVAQWVVAGEGYSCALREDGSARCWGQAEVVVTTPEGSFSRLFGGRGVVCGVDAEGLLCWGVNLPPQRVVTGDVMSAAVGHHHICALGNDRRVSCVGGLNRGQHSPPLEPLRGLISTDFISCGLRIDGTPACWGALETVAAPPQTPMLSMDLGAKHGCGVRPGGALVCWGDAEGGRTTPPEGHLWSAVQVDNQRSCGLTRQGEALCWGDPSLEAQVPGGQFVELTMGEGFACARRAEGEVVCWGASEQGVLQVPAEARFVKIKAAAVGACGITVEGEVRCWGRNLLGFEIPTGGFVDLAPAQWLDSRDPSSPQWVSHHCALDGEGALVCFQRTGVYGEDGPMAGRFREITAGAVHTCAARASDGIVQCTQNRLEGPSAR